MKPCDGVPESRTPQLDALEREVRAGRNRVAAAILEDMAVKAGEYPGAWLRANAHALDSGEWSALGEAFAREEFIGARGDFVLAAPYTIRREAGEHSSLSLLAGQVIPHPRYDLDGQARVIFGDLRQPVTRVIPIRRHRSAGNLGSETGEAFVVPDGWAWTRSGSGPALNDMTEQRRRLVSQGRECIFRVFDAETAERIWAPLNAEDSGVLLQSREYAFHDAGHATGLGLERKLRTSLLQNHVHRGVEEWRSDGIAFELALRMLSREEAGRNVASNLAVRFGIDAHRNGGLERDTDVQASLMTLDCLFRNGALRIHGGRLRLVDASLEGLMAATTLHREEAAHLTRRELRLEHATGLWNLYARDIDVASQEVFEGLIRQPCAGLYDGLR